MSATGRGLLAEFVLFDLVAAAAAVWMTSIVLRHGAVNLSERSGEVRMLDSGGIVR